jgi:hypothetical protein
VSADPEGAAPDRTARLNWQYLWAVGAAVGVTIVVVWADSHWTLNFLHVITGVLWTGIDLFMGFVIGPILRRVDLRSRRAIITQLSPRTLFLMPTLAGVATVTGIELAERAGYFALAWPEYGWLLAALMVVTVLAIQGIGILTPLNLIVFFELRKAVPDMARVGRLMRPYLVIIASQGVMQVIMIAIMARFVTGI